MDESLRAEIKKALCVLKERERQVIVLRFGLEDGHPRTLEEVGKEFNVTRERILLIVYRVEKMEPFSIIMILDTEFFIKHIRRFSNHICEYIIPNREFGHIL